MIINPLRVTHQLKHGYLNIYLDSDWLGFGARFVKTLELLNFANVNCVELNIEYGYCDNVNKMYFGRLFQTKDTHVFSNMKYLRIEDTTEIKRGINLNSTMNIIDANRIFFSVYKIRDTVQSEVDSFVNENFCNKKILGIHYRGTDKVGEAPRMNEFDFIEEIRNCVELFDFKTIFVSTDEMAMLRKIQVEFAHLSVVYRTDSFRSEDGEQFHRKIDNPKDLINSDALTNILILARTNYLLKTASIMSDCVFIFNPNLRYKILSRPYNDDLTWWPASELNSR